MSKKPIMAFVFSIVIAILSIVSTMVGLLYPALCYQKSVLPLFTGEDLTSLIVGVPLLLISTWLAFRKSRRGYLAWLGALGYFLYTYAGYAFAVSNDLLLIYITLFSFSLFALIEGLSALDMEPVRHWFSKNTPTRTLAFFSVLLGILLAYFWLFPTTISFFSGKNPSYAIFLGVPDTIRRALDLGVICPLAMIAGFLIWKHRSRGYAFICFFLFKGITMGLSIIATLLSIKWEQIDYNITIIFGCFALFTLVLSYIFFRNLREETIKSYHDRNSVTYF